MSESVIERVALNLLNRHRARHGLEPATLEAMSDEHRAEWVDDALAAIEAMREPTDKMIAAAFDELVPCHDFLAAWRAGIDAILSEGQSPGQGARVAGASASQAQTQPETQTPASGEM